MSKVRSDDYTDAAGTAAAPFSLGVAPASVGAQLPDASPVTPVAGVLYQENIIKSWVKYTQASPAILDSFNVSAVVDVALGKIRMEFDTDFVDGDYSVTLSTGSRNSSSDLHNCCLDAATAPTSTGVTIINYRVITSGTLADGIYGVHCMGTQ